MSVTAVAPADAGIKVGDFFARSWGYDQTNVDFYKVVGLTGKGVRAQRWSSAVVDDNGPITHVVPGEGPRRLTVWPQPGQAELDACRTCRGYSDSQWGPGVPASAVRWCDEHGPHIEDAPVETKRLSSYDGGRSAYIAVGPYADHARKWDGEPMYETGSGWGH